MIWWHFMGDSEIFTFCLQNQDRKYSVWKWMIKLRLWALGKLKFSCNFFQVFGGSHIIKWYFVTKIVLTYCEKKLFEWSRKTFEIRGWRPRISKIFEITRTIYSNSERSEQFLVTECFFNLFLDVSHI